MNNYIASTKLLHQSTLGSSILSEITFDIENSCFKNSNADKLTDNKHLFISGYARSGTTALMNAFYETKKYASLTYEDMPFLLAPNLWKKLNTYKTKTEFKERAHLDGIFINSESPEAFDEFFWKTFLNNSYIKADRLNINEISSDVSAKYKRYVNLILLKNYNGEKIRYLSKNNNNILRIGTILENFPASNFVILFRDPIQHAISLLNQHNHFCNIHKNDAFSLKYMNWIGHYEFGLNQKSFFLNNEPLFNRILTYHKEDINYWLLNWLNYYSFVLENYSKSCILFSYDKFCLNSSNALESLFNKIDVHDLLINTHPFSFKTRSMDNYNKKIYSDCMDVYNEMLKYS